MLLGWVWASRTGLEGFREGMKQTMFFWPLYFQILADFGSKKRIQKPSFLANFDDQKSQKLGRSSEGVGNTHFGRILEGF